jgi:hypothetical protein
MTVSWIIKNNNNDAFIFSDDDKDENSWCDSCDSCDAKLIERRDGSMVCSNSDCGREYLLKSVNRYKRELQPVESPYDTDGPEIVPMTDYAAIIQPKKESVLDKEDRHWVSKGSGRSITDVDEWFPG